MICERCDRPFTYCFYINDEHWNKVTGGTPMGRICAHCVLEALGGLDWYIIFNEPGHKSMEQIR